MASDRHSLIVVGNDAFSNESFTNLIAKLADKFEITYLPDLSSCVSRARQAAECENDAEIKDPITVCDWLLFSDFTDFADLYTLASLLPKTRLMGYPAFVRCMLQQEKWIKPRPVFNFSMVGVVVCITGYRDRQTVNKLATMVNWMGGSVQRSLNLSTTTHLVAFRCSGEKVRSAALAKRRIATVKASWVEESWDRRTEEPTLNAMEDEFVAKHRARVFQNTCLGFVGFAPGSDELLEMCNLVVEHDGLVADTLQDERLTHVVVTDAWPGFGNILEQLKELLVSETASTTDNSVSTSMVPSIRVDGSPSMMDGEQYRMSMLVSAYRVPVVRLEWFWLSVQLTCLCQLEHYLYVAGPPRSHFMNRPQLPPLAKLNITSPNAMMSGRSSSSLTIGGSPSTTTSPTPHFTALPDVHEIIEEEIEGEVSFGCPTVHSVSDTDARMVDEKENFLPRDEVHSIDSPRTTSDSSPLFSLAGMFKPSPTGKRVSQHSSATDKISFITSPSRHRNSPRGFVSPSADISHSGGGGRISHSRRGKISASGSSSQDDLLTQLADPLSLPSNRERRLCQYLAASDRTTLQGDLAFVTRPANLFDVDPLFRSPESLSSSLLLNATNISDYNTISALTSADRSRGFLSLTGSLRDILSGDDVTPSDPADQTASGPHKNSPTMQCTAETVQPSTSVSGRRKSTNRLSLLHSTARKSRTPGPDLSLNVSVGSGSHGTDFSTTPGTPVQVRLEKRQHRVFEFIVTERNYVDILRYLYRVAYPQVVDDEQSGGAILPRQEADYIFGKLGPIVELHERLQPQLDQLESNWSPTESRLKEVLHIDLLDEMDKAYGNYMQFYSPPHLQHLGEQFPRFLAFMRQVERRKDSGRQSLAALLVRPVQRLPSVALLMDGIVKFTPPSHPDYTAVRQFAKGLNTLLSNINDRLRKNEERLSLLSLYHEINGAPPEMLSSSRSLVARLNVFELGISASGNTTCEPVTLFLLSDSLEVARPRKRHTGEPLAHAIQAALAAVQGDNAAGTNADGATSRDATISADSTQLNSQSVGDCGDRGGGVGGGHTVSVTRTGSGASGSSMMNMGLLEGKQRCNYKHLHLLKLNEIKRVVNFDTASPDRAAFGLVVRSNSEVDDRVYAYCLAASFAASAAVATGRCPEPVESAVAAVTAGSTSSSLSIGGDQHTTVSINSGYVATLQACVSEAKRMFLHRLCHHIVQVSCLVHSPDELLVDVQPEELLGFDLEQVFNATAVALKSKKFSRQLTRHISIKTPRRAGAAPSKQRSMAQATPNRQYGLQPPPYTSGAVDPTYGCSLTSSPRRSVLGTLLGQRVSIVGGEATQSADDAGVDRIASTPLHEKQKYVSSRPPLTPTADQVAMSMLNLMRTPHTAVSQTQSFSLRDGHKMTASSLGDDDVDEYPDVDCASIASSNIGVAFWPARCADSVMSSTSLRSNTLDLGPSHTKDGANNFRTARTSSQPPDVRDTNSRRGPFDRSSVLLSERDLHGQRKSVCRSVLAGLKNFRRSIAGASSAWLHRTSTTASFASSALNRSGRQASTNLLASPGLLNRSASVDAAVCADTMLTAPSPLTSVGDLRASTNTGLHRPAPLAETDLELDAGSPTPPLSPFTPGRSLRLASAASIPPFSTQSPLTAYQSSHVDEPRALFPRSMTINVTTQGQVTTPNSRSLRNLFGVALRNSACSGSSNLVHATYSSSQSSLPLFRKNAPPTPQPPNGQPVDIVVATTEEPCHLDPTETSPYGRLGGSMVSLTSWDSVCTMDVPQTSDALTGFSNARFWSKPSKPKASTGSAVWETASHLGVSTTEESRRSFRLPLMKNHSKDNDEVRKRHKKREKRKLGPLGHLFHRPSSTTNILQHIDTNRNAADVADADITMTHSRSIKSSASRRESLLRGIFSR